MKPRLAQLHQSGATNRQAALWDNVNGYWIPATVVEDVTTTKGDILARTSTAIARVGVGTDGQVLTADSTQTPGVKWATPSSSGAPLTTKGDLFGYGTGDARIPIGADGQVLTADSTQTLGLKWATGGGGGGPTDYVSGASGTGHITIPGMTGSPDIVPGSPSTFDEEFGAALSGWTTLGTPDTFAANTTGFGSHLRLAAAAPGTFQVHGGYKGIPTMPFTVTAKFSDYRNDANYQHHALMLTDATPTALFTWGPTYQSANGIPEMQAINWTNRTTRGSFTEYAGTRHFPNYIRLVVNSSTSVDLWYSLRGMVWVKQASAWNPGFTIAKVGFGVSGQDNSVPLDLAVDWMRFT